MTERELVHNLKIAVNGTDTAEEVLKVEKEKLDKAKKDIIDHFENTGEERTASFEGLGFVSRMKPKVCANLRAERFDDFVEYLKQIDRMDLVKATIHPSSLSAFVGECIEKGQEIPESISYFMKPNCRFYPAKG